MGTCANLVGLQFGHFIVLGKSIYRSRGNHVCWHCQCTCDKELLVSTKDLKRNDNVSCGCMSRYKIDNEAQGFKSFYRTYRSEARVRNLQFELSEIEFRAIVDRDCYYCGQAPMKRAVYKNGQSQPHVVYANGIDRIDSELGYVTGNLVPACSRCNHMKGSLSFREFIDHIHMIAKLHGGI